MAERKAFLLRVDPAVWREIERMAERELRSVNAQVEFLLRDALTRRGVTRILPDTRRQDDDQD